jgi:hypothetical protein
MWSFELSHQPGHRYALRVHRHDDSRAVLVDRYELHGGQKAVAVLTGVYGMAKGTAQALLVLAQRGAPVKGRIDDLVMRALTPGPEVLPAPIPMARL